CALIKILFNSPRAVKLNLFLDEKLYEINTQQISICNGKRMGGAFYMGPEAEIDDGLFDVVFTKNEIPKNKLLGNALKFLNGSQLKFPNFYCVRCIHVKIEALNGTLPIHVVGEEISRSIRKAELFLNQGSIKLLSSPQFA
ncbi:MAG: diacylglycerol kinase family lipid kinase, partial [Sphaerochaetaceae bacterium]|nr:diacylglycerol kinase family lipid kinase [Sphaerochaetaceae bacterium]